jgi:methylenetetrahydrofolate dehydrogenase (NADP+)/methenyltetrahydrofolate cyclohydrolase
VDGVVVQLPLPSQIDKDSVLQAVPREKDPDVFCYGEKHDRLLPPVVGAIDEISKLHKVEWKNKKVVILGEGTLVGKPAARYARKKGAKVRIYTREKFDITSLKTADIIVSGIGQPAFIKSDMVSEGVILFDAGTSEDGGVLVGDVDKGVAEKASLLTPVPGGIGPITIAYLLSNLVQLVRQ